MKRSKFLNLLIFTSIFITSCAAPSLVYRGDYVPSSVDIYLPDSQKLSGKGLVQMHWSDETQVLNKNASSFTGGAVSMSIPLGSITKAISLEVYGNLFREGVSFSNEKEDGYTLIISPKVSSLDYYYDQLSNAGFAITPKVELSANIRVLDKNKNETFSRTYLSGMVKGDTYFLNTSPSEAINKVIHIAIHQVIKESFNDIRLSVK